jgi:hypothetical protein
MAMGIQVLEVRLGDGSLGFWKTMERSSKRGAAEYHDQFGRFPHSLPIQFVVVEALLVFEIPCLRKMDRDG